MWGCVHYYVGTQNYVPSAGWSCIMTAGPCCWVSKLRHNTFWWLLNIILKMECQQSHSYLHVSTPSSLLGEHPSLEPQYRSSFKSHQTWISKYSCALNTSPLASFSSSVMMDIRHCSHWRGKYHGSLSWPLLQHGPISTRTLGHPSKCSHTHTPWLDTRRSSWHLSFVRFQNNHPEWHDLWTCDLAETQWLYPHIVLQHPGQSQKYHRNK